MVLWMYPGYEDSEEAKKMRDELSKHGFNWEEKIEEAMSEPVCLDTGFEDFGTENLSLLDNYSYSDEGKLLFRGMTEEEFASKFKTPYDETKAEDAFIEETNDSYDK